MLLRRILTESPLRAACVAFALLALAGSPTSAAGTAIQVPGTVDPGQPVAVILEDGQGAGSLEVRGPDRGQGADRWVAAYPVAGSALTLLAPDEPGTYELRWLDPAGKLLARRRFDVAAQPVSLTAPQSLGAGYDERIGWTGPGAPGDMIQIYDPTSGRVLAEAPAVGTPGAHNATLIHTPDWRGPAKLRYWHGASGAALRSLDITIGAGTGWLRAPIEVKTGERFVLEWQGASSIGLAYELVDPASGSVLQREPAADASGATVTGRLKAPKRAGQYRVRMVNAETGFVVTDLPLQVDAN